MKTRILIITSLFFLFCGCTKKNLTDESTTSKITPVVVNQDSNPSENKLVDELLVKKDLELFEKEDDYRLLQNENDISDKFNGPFTSLYMYEIEPLVGEGTTFEIIQNLNKENAYRVYVYSSFGQTIYTCINDTESNYWYLEKKAIFYKEPFETEDSEENVTYFCYNGVCEKQVGRKLIKAEINTEPAVIDFKTAESLIGLINKNKNKKIEIQTKNSGIKQTSLLYEDGILTIDHIKSKVIDISIPKTMPVKKVIFNFVDLTEVTEDFWKSFEETECFVFSFTTLNNLEFITYLKNAKAISFKESNYIESYSVSLSSNQNLEYLEIQALDLSEIKFKNTIYENLKYLVIYNAKFTDNCYERIINYFGKETCYIINKEQMAYFTKYKYAEPDIIYDVWDEYNIQ